MENFDQDVETLEAFSDHILNAMSAFNVDDKNPAMISFGLADILALYAVHSNIPIEKIVHLVIDLYRANRRIANEEQPATLQ